MRTLAVSQLLDAICCTDVSVVRLTRSSDAVMKLQEHLMVKPRGGVIQKVRYSDAAVAALTEGRSVCALGLAFGKSCVKVLGSVVPAEQDLLLNDMAPGFDLRRCTEVMQQAGEKLVSNGFAVMPYSGELIDIVRTMQEPDMEFLRNNRVPPDVHYSRAVVAACIAQLKLILPQCFAVLGLYKARFRGNPDDHAQSLHKDDVQLAEDDVRLALFPPLTSLAHAIGDPFERYHSFCADAVAAYPSLSLPCLCDELEQVRSTGDFNGLTKALVSSIARYNELQASRDDELVFSNVNVWIPRDSKRLMFLPLEDSAAVNYPLSVGDCTMIEERCAGKFQAFRGGVALVFFGQSVLHQALIGPDFDCGRGSLEGRYLVLTTRAHTQNGSLRNYVSEI